MAYDLSGVDVFFLSKELKELENSKVDKIVQADRQLFLFRFFSGKEKKTLRLLVPELVNITTQKYESPQTPLGFCTFLRKYLQNTKVKKVYQHEFERTIIFQFETLKYGDIYLILEFFKPGNMILCRKEGEKLIILNSLERQVFKSRKVGSGEEYIFPQEQANPSDLSFESLKEIFCASEKILGKTLAMDLSLGGTYAEEIVARAGLDKKEDAKSLSSEEIKKIHSSLAEFFSESIFCGGAKGKVYPVKMRSLEFEKGFESFNQGLDSLPIETSAEEKKTGAVKEKKSKTEALLGIQKKRISELEREINENQKAGEFIYEHYQEFSKLTDAIRKMRANGKSYDEIESALKKNKHFRTLDKSKKTIHMEF